MSTPANNQELVESVVEVTGSTQAEAQHLLTACDNNVEAAVALFFEQEALGTSNQIDDSDPSLDVDLDESDVRAPIAPVREQLVGVDDDNFVVGAPNLPGRTSRGVPRVKVCPFRDFAREGELMENELQGAVLPTSSNSSRNLNNSDIRARRLMRAIAMGTTAVDHKSRLDDLFRPPTDIAYAGTFQTARTRATELKHWLLVNVQSDSFDSQVLNRDVWSDKEVRKLIRRQFMLWQVDSETAEGRRFVAFYHCNKLPYVCVIDPRTGEELWKAVETKKKNVLKDLQSFLNRYNDLSQEISDNGPTTSKRSAECITIDDDEDTDNLIFSGNNETKRSKLVELTEEEQMALAIRNSIQENGVEKTISDDEEDGEIEEVNGNDVIKSESTSYETLLGQAKNELTILKLRLINTQNEEQQIQLRWPSDTILKALRLYILENFPKISENGYKIICAFPRKNLGTEHDDKTFKELCLHPSANLHITLDD